MAVFAKLARWCTGLSHWRSPYALRIFTAALEKYRRGQLRPKATRGGNPQPEGLGIILAFQCHSFTFLIPPSQPRYAKWAYTDSMEEFYAHRPY